MRTLRGILGGYFYNKTILTPAGLPTIAGVLVTPEGRNSLRLVEQDAELTVETHDSDVYYFQPGGKLEVSDDCSELLHEFTIDGKNQLFSMKCLHSVPPPPP